MSERIYLFDCMFFFFLDEGEGGGLLYFLLSLKLICWFCFDLGKMFVCAFYFYFL